MGRTRNALFILLLTAQRRCEASSQSKVVDVVTDTSPSCCWKGKRIRNYAVTTDEQLQANPKRCHLRARSWRSI